MKKKMFQQPHYKAELYQLQVKYLLGENSNEYFEELLITLFSDLEDDEGLEKRVEDEDYNFFEDAGLADLLKAVHGSMDEKSQEHNALKFSDQH